MDSETLTGQQDVLVIHKSTVLPAGTAAPDEMHDLLFENQDALEDEDLARYAAALGLDVPRFMTDVLAGKYARTSVMKRGTSRPSEIGRAHV